MTHYGALCNPGLSHLMTMASVGQELQKRGHRFTLFGVPELAGVAEKHGISFQALNNSRDYLPLVTTFLDNVAAGLSFREMLRCGIGEIKLYCEEGPKAMQDCGIQCLIGDQLVIAARTIAERLNITFVTICSAIPLSTSAEVPPFTSLWGYKPVWWARCRNRLTYQIVALCSMPFSRSLNVYRRRWGLAPRWRLEESFSPLAQITQLVREFDFPFEKPPANLCYVGPYRRHDLRPVDFPYERLDGRPLIFAALGTILGASPGIWKTIAESCLALDAQLLISLGGRGRVEDYQDLPGHPLVVCYAPQCELLKRAALMITHGGLNSVMEALAEGVPLITLPAFSDQHGVAARVAASGAGEFLTLKRCRTETLAPLVKRVFTDPSYKMKASLIQNAVRTSRGVEEAADIIEELSQGRAPLVR